MQQKNTVEHSKSVQIGTACEVGRRLCVKPMHLALAKALQVLGVVSVVWFGVAPSLVEAAAKKPLAAKSSKVAKAETSEAGDKAGAAQDENELVLTTAFSADHAAQLGHIVARFNASQKEMHIRVVDQYAEGSAQPAMQILDEDDSADMAASKNRFKPLWQVMQSAAEPLDVVSKMPPMVSRLSLDDKGRMLGLPVGLSTPVMFYNKAIFRKAGVDARVAPRSWWELQEALGRVRDIGSSCPYTSTRAVNVHVENTSAWHGAPVVRTAGRNEVPAFNGLLQIKHLAMMTSWVKSRYYVIPANDREAEQRFLNGECAVITTTQAFATTAMRKQGLDFGVGKLPYHDDVADAPRNTLADGPVLWVSSRLNKKQEKVVASFVRFLLTPEIQVEWQRDMGYLPLNRAGAAATLNSQLLQEDLQAQRVAIEQLLNKPAVPATSSSRLFDQPATHQVLDKELKDLWQDKIPAKQALDNAASRLSNGRR